jgi:hypothetical protein
MRSRTVTVPKNNLVKISYIGDLSYSPPDGVLLIDGDGDYVGACHVLSCEQEPEVAISLSRLAVPALLRKKRLA